MRKASNILYLVGFIVGLVDAGLLLLTGILQLVKAINLGGSEGQTVLTYSITLLVYAVLSLISAFVSREKRNKGLAGTDNTSTHAGGIACGIVMGNAPMVVGAIFGLIALGRKNQ